MYEHYERNRTDNITDPAVRRAHPISTISGWDRERVEDTTVVEASAATVKVTNATKAIVDASSQINGEQISNERAHASNKSEHTDDGSSAMATTTTTMVSTATDAIVVENVKCVCDDTSDENANTDVDASNDKTKPISSISNISQVYNEQLSGQTVVCNGEASHSDEQNVDTSGSIEPTNESVNSSGSDALRQTLEIDGYDLNEDNKEIVDEIVAEILAKSETALDECKQTFDESHMNESEPTSSPVIKDEEIEHAVNEVVKGVRNIEKLCKKDEDDDKTSEMDANLNESSLNEPDDNQNVGEDIDENAGVALEPRPLTQTANTTDEIKEIVSTIVNDVIENCVNQTNKTITNDVCDNDTSNMSINQDDINADSINNNNNNDADVMRTTTITATNDNNDNAIIAEAIVSANEELRDVNTTTAAAVNKTETIVEPAPATTTMETVEESNEDIVKGIVDEIVDKCVEQEMNAANIDNTNNNNNNEDAATDTSNSNENVAENQMPTPLPTPTSGITPNECDARNDMNTTQNSANNISTDANETIDNRGIEPYRTQTKSISTSTQVENNHFGKLNYRKIALFLSQ